MQRRRFITTLGTTGIVAVAGCAGGATTFEAEPAGTASDTASETGYERSGIEEQTVTREFAGQEVEVINKITTYEKTLSLSLFGEARLGVFAAVSTPAVEVGGETFNPVGDQSTDELVDLLASNYENIRNPESVAQEELTILGGTRTVDKFAATATFDGQEVDIFIHLPEAIRDEADFVIPIGIYPQQLETVERSNVLDLMRDATHPVE